MAEFKVYNSGKLVSRAIDLGSFRGPDAKDQLIAAINDACEHLEDVRFEGETEVYNYGDSVAHDLVVYGTPTGDLARQAEILWRSSHGAP